MDNQTLPAEIKFPGPIELFKESWHLYKNRFWVLLGIYIIPSFLVLVATIVVGGGAAIGVLLGAKINLVVAVVLAILAVLIFLAFIYIGVWAQTALLVAIKGSGEQLDFRQSFKMASGKVFSLFGASLLSGLAVSAIMLVGGGIIFVLYAFVLPKEAIFYVLEGLIGLVVLIWSIKIGVELSFGTYVVVGDNTKALSGVLRSRDYVKGRWWAIFLRVIFLAAVAIVYYLVSAAVVSLLAKLPGGAGLILSSLVNIVLSVIAPPLFVVYAYKIYEHLRAVKGESQIPVDKSSKAIVAAAIVVAVILIVAFVLGIGTLMSYLNPFRSPYSPTNQINSLSPAQIQQLQQNYNQIYNVNPPINQ